MSAAKLAVLTALWLVATALGTFGANDTDLRLRMTHSWLTGAPQVEPGLPPPSSREDIDNGVLGRDGQRHIFYEPGQSVLMLPGEWAGAKVAHWLHAPSQKRLRVAGAVWLVFLPLNILMVLACYWLLLAFGYRPTLAAAGSLIWLLGTTALPYAQVAFQNNQVLLCVILAHAAILAWVRSRRRWLLVGSGLAAGAAVLLRASCIIHVFTIGLFLLACIAIARTPRREGLGAVATWAAALMPAVLVGRIYDYNRFGSFFTTGQTVWLQQINSDPLLSGLPALAPHFPFSNDTLVGILGVLFSPAKSLFIYDPLLLPCAVLAVLTWRSLTPYVRAFIAAAVLNLLLHIALTSRLEFWHGDWAWAARYHITSVDLLLVPLIVPLIKSALGAGSRGASLARWLIAASLLVQFLAVSMPYGEETGVEALQDYSSCDRETWDLPLGFRLGNRVRNLYCLSSESTGAQCPASVAAQALRAHPSCRGAVRELNRSTRLAFFPFDPDNGPVAARIELAVWGAALLAAIVLTTLWLRALFGRPSAIDTATA